MLLQDVHIVGCSRAQNILVREGYIEAISEENCGYEMSEQR